MLCLPFLLSGCASDEYYEDDYEHDYEAGYDKGYAEGYNEGYEEGYNLGRDDERIDPSNVLSEEEFDEAIKELARKEFATGKRDDDAYRKLCMQHGETVSPDRKAIYESSMKKTGGKMNAACMFWDSKGNKTLSYNPESRNWKAISTDEEFARARVFTSIYNDELARLKEEYGEKAKGNVSYSKIKVDISAERSKEKNNNEGNTIDLQI